jgi:hypothetical protein
MIEVVSRQWGCLDSRLIQKDRIRHHHRTSTSGVSDPPIDFFSLLVPSEFAFLVLHKDARVFSAAFAIFDLVIEGDVNGESALLIVLVQVQTEMRRCSLLVLDDKGSCEHRGSDAHLQITSKLCPQNAKQKARGERRALMSNWGQG